MDLYASAEVLLDPHRIVVCDRIIIWGAAAVRKVGAVTAVTALQDEAWKAVRAAIIP